MCTIIMLIKKLNFVNKILKLVMSCLFFEYQGQRNNEQRTIDSAPTWYRIIKIVEWNIVNAVERWKFKKDSKTY